MFKPNTFTQLIAFFLLAVIVNVLNLNYLLFILILLLVIIVIKKSYDFYRSVHRFKWFFLVMLTIFSFNTPGEHIAAWPLDISPTYEGLKLGFTQLIRIVVILAGLSLVLAINTKQQLISGFYFLFSPLKIFGIKVERFAARLWLTLHYVEQQNEQNTLKDKLLGLKNMAAVNDIYEEVSITFEPPIFKLIDYFVLLLIIVSITFFIIKGFA